MTFAVSNSTVGATNTVYYRTEGGEWTAVDSRTGDGEVMGTIEPGHYHGYVISSNYAGETASLPVSFRVVASGNIESQYRVTRIDEVPGSEEKVLILEKIDKPLVQA